MKFRNTFALASVSLLALSMPAFAQDAADEAKESDIVVTGTLVRGIAPAGTNVIGVTPEKIEETGASTVTQLLQTVPQFGSFNTIQAPIGGGNFVTTNRPNLRNLPGFTTTGGAATLMLVDGHRVVGMGVSSSTPDADAIAPGAIGRVEIIPDGGSAIYGADAVAGVVNFITRKNVNGVEADANYGFAKNYNTFDANFTAGKTWDGGGAVISYNFSRHDAIYGRDRDYVRIFPAVRPNGQTVVDAECSPGSVNPQNLGATGISPSPDVYGLPYTPATLAASRNVYTQCDSSDFATVYPEERRHSVFASVQQDIGDSLKFETTAFYMNRKQFSSQGRYHATTLLSSFNFSPEVATSPFVNVYDTSPGFIELHQVSWAYGDSNSLVQNIGVKAWGIAPSFTYDLGGSWQARALASYGESTSEQHSSRLDAGVLTRALPSGLFNPYNPTSSNAAALAIIGGVESFGLTKQRQFDVRLVVDGDLAQLPGGAIKLAAGVEYIDERYKTQRGDTLPGRQDNGYSDQVVNGVTLLPAKGAIPIFDLGRNTKSVFGELVVPFFSQENSTTGIQELTLSISGRYDDYSDFGGTFNPKFGITWKPADWLRLRAAWGKSFAAPSLADSDLADPVAANFATGGIVGFLAPTAVVVANGGTAPTPQQTNLLVLLGGTAGLKPQKATTWSVGADIEPTGIDGLRMSLTYFNISYDNVIAQPPFTTPTEFFSTFKNSYIVNPTPAQIAAATGLSSTIVGTPCTTCVYVIEDVRKANLGRFRLSGLDFSANYLGETSFGSVDLNVGGSYELTRKQSGTLVSGFTNLLAANNSKLKMRSSIGATVGDFRAQATWSHSQGYTRTPAVPAAGAFPAQDRIGSYNVIDLFFKYNLPGMGALKDAALTLGINNVLDRDPPQFRAQQIVLAQNGYANGSTVGRLVQIGISTKF
jgi:iron complex outermembrane recepter protein